jgi:hypothetical protein
MKRSILAVLGVVLLLLHTGAPAFAGASGLPKVSDTGSSMSWHTDPASMTLHLRVADATNVSVQMTGYVFGSKPTPGLHLYKRTARFPLVHSKGEVWTATRHDDASVGVAMSDRSTVAVRACDAAGCINTDAYFHMAGE